MIVHIFLNKQQTILALTRFGNQIENEDGSYEMIEYDGCLDRSRLNFITF